MGLTVTLHKGKNKSATDPSNYRAISLLPAVFKIFEKIIINRFESIRPELKTIKLQYGFQRGKSCKMASFTLQESRDFCIELGNPLRACYLDAKATFDKVWLTGLVYKLHTIGIRGKLLRIVNSTLRGTISICICAPFYYTVFINDLLKDLSASTYGLHIGEVPLSAPTQADDIVLLSLSRRVFRKC